MYVVFAPVQSNENASMNNSAHVDAVSMWLMQVKMSDSSYKYLLFDIRIPRETTYWKVLVFLQNVAYSLGGLCSD